MAEAAEILGGKANVSVRCDGVDTSCRLFKTKPAVLCKQPRRKHRDNTRERQEKRRERNEQTHTRQSDSEERRTPRRETRRLHTARPRP